MEKKQYLNMSDRLVKIASKVDKGSRVADVGTDHGYVPIYLALNGVAESAVAMDVNEGPLDRAQQNIIKMGVADKVSVRLSDGLDKLKEGEADTVIIAGMGGKLTIRILENGAGVLEKVDTLILSPHSDIELVRIYLINNNYNITDEDMVIDDGKYYNILKAVHGKSQSYSEEEVKYGKILLEKKDDVLSDYLLKEQEKYKVIYNRISAENGEDDEKLEVIRQKLDIISKAFERMRNGG